jgi:hypothetical protein
MTNKLFDSFVNDKLKDYESPVPDGLWEKIIAEEDEKPKVIFWWNKNAMLIGVGLLLFISGIGYYAVSKKSNVEILIANSQSKQQNNTNTNPNNLNNIQLDNNNSKNTTNSSTANLQTSISENLALDAAINNSKKEKNIEQTNEVIVNNNNKEASSLSAANEFGFKNANVGNAKKIFISKKKTSKNQTFLTKQKSIINKLNQGVKSDANLFGTDFYETSQPRENGVLVVQESNVESANNLKEKQVLALGKLFSGSDDCPTTKGTHRNDIYVEAYVSPDFAFKNVLSTKAGNDAYLQKKDSSESMSLGYTIGARFSKSITNNLLLKAGLQYSQMSEKFTLRTENDRRQTIVINSHTIVRPNQPDTTISDTSVFVQIGYRVRTNMNYYKSLEIPVILSYEFPQHDESKWKLALNAGAIVNITSWYDGKTIDAGYNLVNIGSKSNNGFYKHQFGVSLYGGLSIIRNITSDLDVFAEPYFRYGLYNVKGGAGFNQKFNLAGIQLGARLKISKNKHL